ncbi:MAG: Uma2 family endonuclease [Cyanobacteria bacterium J06576_12]
MIAQPKSSVRWTTRDLEVLPKNEWTTYEIIDGELFVTRSPHIDHQEVGGNIHGELRSWSKQTGLGKAIFGPGIVLSDADNVIPDVVWVSKTRLPLITDESGHLTKMPEIVIEVLSAGADNIRRDREAKLKFYSVQGVQEYWIADRFTKQLEVYRREEGRLSLVMTLTDKDTLTSPLLPEFACPLQQIFV